MATDDIWRGDHRDALEHGVIYLGDIVIRSRKDPESIIPYNLRQPIATNQTRFLNIAIHEMKMVLLIDQFEQDEEGRKEAEAGHR